MSDNWAFHPSHWFINGGDPWLWLWSFKTNAFPRLKPKQSQSRCCRQRGTATSLCVSWTLSLGCCGSVCVLVLFILSLWMFRMEHIATLVNPVFLGGAADVGATCHLKYTVHWLVTLMGQRNYSSFNNTQILHNTLSCVQNSYSSNLPVWLQYNLGLPYLCTSHVCITVVCGCGPICHVFEREEVCLMCFPTQLNSPLLLRSPVMGGLWCKVIRKKMLFASAAKVGKTSLIMSLVSEEFPDEVCTHSQSDVVVLVLCCQRGWFCLPGSAPRWGDHHPSRRHPREGPHTHRGLLG